MSANPRPVEESDTESRKRIAWLGHSTVLIDLDGTRLITDPVLRSRVAHLRRGWAPDAGLLRGVDAILVSHVHFDHLDLPSLERIGKELPVVVPRGAGRLLRGRRFAHVVEVDVGDEISVGAVRVAATPALHDASRGPLGVRAASLGYAVLGSRRVYFAGDTDLFPEMDGLVADLDVALLPVGGWGARVGPGHLDVERAVAAMGLLRPDLAVPIHYGTYYPATWNASRRGAAAEVGGEFAHAAAERAAGLRVVVLPPNGVLELD